MVYIDPDELRWMPYVKTWLSSMKKHLVHEETPDFILELFSRYVDQGLKFVNRKCTQMINQVRYVLSKFIKSQYKKGFNLVVNRLMLNSEDVYSHI